MRIVIIYFITNKFKIYTFIQEDLSVIALDHNFRKLNCSTGCIKTCITLERSMPSAVTKIIGSVDAEP